jgi:RNA polymerase-binding transcription factor
MTQAIVSRGEQEDRTVHATALRHYKRVLLAKRREALAMKAGVRGSVPGAGAEPGDAIDRAVADSEAGIQARLRETESHLLRAIDEALKRIERGTLGVCQTCGKTISRARLDAVPWAQHCRECKEQLGD